MEVLVLSLGAVLALFRFVQSKVPSMLSRKTIYWLGCFFFLGFLSSLQAYSIRHALYEWSSFGLLLLLAWTIALELREAPDALLRKVLLICGIGCVLYFYKEFFLYILALQIDGQPNPEVFIFGFDNLRFFNHIQTISLPLLGLWAVHSALNQRNESRFTSQIFPFIATSFWWMMLFVSAGRGTFIGVFAGIIGAWLFQRRLAMPWCRVMIITCLAGLCAYAIFFVTLPILVGLQPFGFLSELGSRTLSDPTSSRLSLWWRAWEMILAHPIFGAGPLHFAHYATNVQFGAHPHNWILQIASEWGVPAVFCLIVVIVIAFRSLMRTATKIKPGDEKNQAALAAFLATGIAILVDGLVSGLIVMPTSQLWIVLYVGCAWGWVSSLSNETKALPPEGSQVLHKAALALTVLVLLICFGCGLWPEILSLPKYEAKAVDSGVYVRNVLRPRLWKAGYF
ncbi:O-antigen ligase [Glaciimonas sp. PCH181]|uniref:O-antigen ligase family protein n=1 Tax=Glaciimonas sp. PCH181 TaxID=2133943 RepID=UPI001374E050|nr:O-antigen ligase family protein [Glaciimonas sp. PCH181]